MAVKAVAAATTTNWSNKWRKQYISAPNATYTISLSLSFSLFHLTFRSALVHCQWHWIWHWCSERIMRNQFFPPFFASFSTKICSLWANKFNPILDCNFGDRFWCSWHKITHCNRQQTFGFQMMQPKMMIEYCFRFNNYWKMFPFWFGQFCFGFFWIESSKIEIE